MYSTFLLLTNKGLICCHFFRVATYSQSATYHITLISSRWYLDPNIEQETLLQQMSAIILCSTTNSEENPPITDGTFKHLFSIRSTLCNSRSTVKPSNKIIYAELFGLSKKVIDSAIKVDMYQELSDMFKAFLYDTQNKIDKNQQINEDYIVDVNNPNITKHKGCPPKRLQSNIEKISSKGKHVSRVSNANNENAESSKGRKCGRCKQYGHYAKTKGADISQPQKAKYFAY